MPKLVPNDRRKKQLNHRLWVLVITNENKTNAGAIKNIPTLSRWNAVDNVSISRIVANKNSSADHSEKQVHRKAKDNETLERYLSDVITNTMQITAVSKYPSIRPLLQYVYISLELPYIISI